MAERKAGFHSDRILDKGDSKNGKMDSSCPVASPPKQPHENTVSILGLGSDQEDLYGNSKVLACPSCPECTSQRVWRDGLRETSLGGIQRWLCRDCGYRFSENGPKKPLQEASSWQLNSALDISSSRQVCEFLTEDSKNLATSETRIKEQAAGATKPSEAETKGKIIEFSWKLKKEGRAETTISSYCHLLLNLRNKGADLYDPESVKDVIARQDGWSSGRKSNAVKAYTAFLKMHGQTWEKPKYKPVFKLPFIPTEAEIDDLIAGSSRQISTFLRLLKETGMRCGEAFTINWTDVDLVNNTVRITPEKGSNPRIFKISNTLAIMLGNLPKKSLKLFSYKNPQSISRSFRRQRIKLAHKLGNPRLLQIHLHTFRHWKATTEYAKTKDILHVMRLLGHKKIENTLIYTHLIAFQGPTNTHAKPLAQSTKPHN